MIRKLLTIGLLVVVLILGAGVALVTGIGPAPGSPGDGSIDTPDGSFPTATATPTSTTTTTTGSTAGTSTATTTGPPLTLTVDRIEQCGRTCRDVTTSLTNRQSHSAEDVVVYSRVFVGNDTDGDVVWSTKHRAGSLAPGETVTTTDRIELSYSAAYAVMEADGWITIQTTIRTADTTLTITKQYNVS
ncbi:MAG: hypothetical protein SVG88_05425 [Halobacteriales archaeon]|nr:hypothetical protein [Halobacteriales archaeon]